MWGWRTQRYTLEPQKNKSHATFNLTAHLAWLPVGRLGDVVAVAAVVPTDAGVPTAIGPRKLRAGIRSHTNPAASEQLTAREGSTRKMISRWCLTLHHSVVRSSISTAAGSLLRCTADPSCYTLLLQLKVSVANLPRKATTEKQRDHLRVLSVDESWLYSLVAPVSLRHPRSAPSYMVLFLSDPPIFFIWRNPHLFSEYCILLPTGGRSSRGATTDGIECANRESLGTAALPVSCAQKNTRFNLRGR